MPTYRETWHFAGAQGASWEEVYEVRVPEGENQMPLKNAPVLLNRMACAHATVSLSKITSRNLEDPSEPPAESPYNLTGTANNGAGDPANTDEAAVILLGCQELGGPRKGHRFLWMRGLEETAVSRNATSGNPVLSDDFRDNLNRFLGSLQSAAAPIRRYGMRPRQRSSWDGPLFRYRITGIGGNPASDVTVLTLSEAPGWARGAYIQINDTNRKILPGLRGIFRVEEIVGDAISIAYRPAQANPPVSGYAYVIVRDAFLVVDRSASGFSFLGSRQTKKPVTGSRGRRSAVRLRR